MVSFRGKKKKAWATPGSVSFRGLIQNFRRATPPISYAESPNLVPRAFEGKALGTRLGVFPPPPSPGSELIQNLKQGSFFKFMAVMENINQEDHLVLKGAAKVLLQGMSVTWTSPLSDNNKKLASLAFTQFTLPVLP